jgi:hypothetical protein
MRRIRDGMHKKAPNLSGLSDAISLASGCNTATHHQKILIG